MEANELLEMYGKESLAGWLIPVMKSNSVKHLPPTLSKVLLAEELVSFWAGKHHLTELGEQVLSLSVED